MSNKYIICFSDILGYKSLASNNDSVPQGIDIIKMISEAPSKIIEDLFDSRKIDTINFTDIKKHFKTLVFSDTILLAYPYNQENIEDRIIAWMATIWATSVLQEHLFGEGLPIRGAITLGELIVHEHSFIGKGIVEAHETGQSVDLAGIVLTEQASIELDRVLKKGKTNEISKAVNFPKFYAYFIAHYLVPFKNNINKKLKIVDFTRSKRSKLLEGNADIRKFVSDSFWKHNKDIPPKSYKKLTNTELLIRYLLSRT